MFFPKHVYISIGIRRGLIALLLLSSPTYAQSAGSGIDLAHEKWSKKVLQAADSLDSYFGDERIEDDAQQTRIEVTLDYKSIEGGSDELGAGFSARISLPRLDNRWSLVINGDEEGDGLDQTDDDNDNSLAFRFSSTNNILKHLSFDVGIRRPDDSYELFGRVRHRITTPHKKWISRLDNKLYYYDNYGAEYDGRLDFDLALPPSLLFRYKTRIRWWEADKECGGGVCPEQHFILYQRMKSPKHALAYEFSTFFQSDPDDGSDDKIDKSRLRLRYRHNTKFDWLFFEVRPTLTFDRENDYDEEWSMLIRLEGIFGYSPKYQSLDFGPEKILDN
jgi:hypothetical protein